ncbi:MAG: type IV pilus twitching motility protein PilT [Polaromonas sp.]
MKLLDILKAAYEADASDIHLVAGHPPVMRVHTVITPMDLPPLTPELARPFFEQMAPKESQARFEANKDADFSFFAEGLARYRVNCHMQRSMLAMAMRMVKTKVPPLEKLNLPEVIVRLTYLPRGLVLVTGDTGSGKSTTLAAMVNYLNENEYGHILTVEDPIEFVHESKKCLINQREVGPHTLSFAAALKSALREDPDAILVGEMRDLETIRLAMTAAETGHLVFGTLHTSSAAKTIDRIIDVFPAEEKEMIRSMLSESLQAVISQTLCKTKDGTGRVAAHEIMLGTSAIRNLIREAKVAQMYSSIQTGNSVGMQTLDQNLTELVKRNVISASEARGKAKIPENFPGN